MGILPCCDMNEWRTWCHAQGTAHSTSSTCDLVYVTSWPFHHLPCLTISHTVGLTISHTVGLAISHTVGLTISHSVGLTISQSVGLTISHTVDNGMSVPSIYDLVYVKSWPFHTLLIMGCLYLQDVFLEHHIEPILMFDCESWTVRQQENPFKSWVFEIPCTAKTIYLNVLK